MTETVFERELREAIERQQEEVKKDSTVIAIDKDLDDMEEKKADDKDGEDSEESSYYDTEEEESEDEKDEKEQDKIVIRSEDKEPIKIINLSKEEQDSV